MGAAGALHCTLAVEQEAIGALAAQSVVERLQDEWTTPKLAWLAYCEVAARYGKHSPACVGFIGELAKRAAGAA